MNADDDAVYRILSMTSGLFCQTTCIIYERFLITMCRKVAVKQDEHRSIN